MASRRDDYERPPLPREPVSRCGEREGRLARAGARDGEEVATAALDVLLLADHVEEIPQRRVLPFPKGDAAVHGDGAGADMSARP